jgi:hypothetical protein
MKSLILSTAAVLAGFLTVDMAAAKGRGHAASHPSVSKARSAPHHHAASHRAAPKARSAPRYHGPRHGTHGGYHARHTSGGHHARLAYHHAHGHRFAHGYYYKGRNHHHWTKRYWHSGYRCYLYYCPDTLAYYYWCAPDNCYYPVSYCPYKTYSFQSNDDAVDNNDISPDQ